MPKTMRYVNYGRVSSIKQKDEETIEMQQDALRAFAAGNRLTVVDEYYDEAQSGTLPFADRPEGRRLLIDAKAKKFDAVLFYRTDRLGRSAFEGLRICQQLSELGIAIRSISENYDTSTPTGKLVFTMLLALAENELATIKKRMNDGKQRKLRRGLSAVAGQPPYGYVRTPEQKLAIDNTPAWGDKTKADIVRYIFETTVNENLGAISMATRLNDLGVPAHGSGSWAINTVLGIIKNPKYKGIAYYNLESKLYDDIIEIEIPPIVSPELWQAANDGLPRRKTFNRQRNSHHYYLLGQGLIRCAHCGYAYVGVFYNNKPAHHVCRYYKCSGKSRRTFHSARKTDHLCTAALPVPADWIENVVWSECCKLLTNTKYADETLRAYYANKPRRENDVNTKDIERTIQEIKKQRDELISMRLKNIITEDDIAARLPKLDKQIAELKKQLEKLQQDAPADIDTEMRNTKETLRKLKKALPAAGDFETKRAIVQALVQSVTVTTNDDRTISIDVTLNFGPQGLGRKAIEKIRELGIDTREKLAKTAAEISTSYATCLHKVGRNNNGRPLQGETRNSLPECAPRQRIDAGGRFIKK